MPTSLSLGQCATLACIWEATAYKPGNVYRGADFEDLTYVEFLTSATVIGPIIEQAPVLGVGRTILAAVKATQAAVGTNTNLGILLLLAPLAAQPAPDGTGALSQVLANLDQQDAAHGYEAIRLAQPGGMGEVPEADLTSDEPPQISLLAAMQLAADRDLIARQYTNEFAEVHWLADRLEQLIGQGHSINEAITEGFLQLLSRERDSLIARKCGSAVAQEVSTRAAAVLEAKSSGHEAYESALADFDFHLRSDGHRRNPGTTADVVAAALFLLLRDGRIDLPVRFYG